jgi:hypothetical protein
MVNLAITMLDQQFMDRDLNTTGAQVITISAGTGVYEVSQELMYLTEHRIIDKGWTEFS